MAKQSAEPWEKPAPKKTKHTKLTPASKAKAKASAKKAGRSRPSLVDNMNAAKAQKKSAGKTKKSGSTKSSAKSQSGTKSPSAAKSKSGTKKKSAAQADTSKAKKTATKSAAKKSASKSTPQTSKAAATKDPKGGLTAAGRKKFEKEDGSHLQPGVKKAQSEMSPTEMRRKGSWASRFYGREGKLPPLKKPDGSPTRFALTAAAWGEPIPTTVADARKIAAEGRKLLAAYKKATAKPAPRRKKTAA